MFNLGFLVNTYNRIDDAKINLELIRKLWSESKQFGDIKIVHTYNGEPELYPEKYLEDELVVIQNTSHFQGASELIDAGIEVFKQKYPELDYIIIVAADTWLINPEYILNILKAMKDNNQFLATCSWGFPDRNDLFEVGMAVDFFIVDLKWAIKYQMFPLNYKDFADKYAEFLLYYRGSQVMLEKLTWMRFVQAIFRESKNNVGLLKANALSRLYHLKDREPVHRGPDETGNWQREPYWEKMGLLTHHDLEPKMEILKKFEITLGK